MKISCQSCRFNFKLDRSAVKATGTLVRCSRCRAVFRVYPPHRVKHRKHSRVKTQNLISYFSFNKDHKLISHGLGVALDISKGGILLETPYSIESTFLVLTATDKRKNIIEVKGRLIMLRAVDLINRQVYLLLCVAQNVRDFLVTGQDTL